MLTYLYTCAQTKYDKHKYLIQLYVVSIESSITSHGLYQTVEFKFLF